QESDAVDRAYVTESGNRLPGGNLPQSDGAIVTARSQQPAVRGEHDGQHFRVMPLKQDNLAPGGQIPEACGGINTAGRQETPIRGGGKTIDPRRIAPQAAYVPQGGGVPESHDRLVIPDVRQKPSLPAKRQGFASAWMASEDTYLPPRGQIPEAHRP